MHTTNLNPMGFIGGRWREKEREERRKEGGKEGGRERGKGREKVCYSEGSNTVVMYE